MRPHPRCFQVTTLALLLAGCEGPVGSRGATGATGADGHKGAPGDTGSKGDPGDPGQPGDPGAPGDRGEPGEPGPQGPRGPLPTQSAPGLSLSIVSARLDADRRFEVELTLADDKAVPLDRTGVLTEGAIAATFVFAQRDGEHFTDLLTRTETAGDRSATQGTGESTGTFTTLDTGRYRYVSKLQLDAAPAVDASLRVAAYATRTFQGWLWVGNDARDFGPSGDARDSNDAVTTAACNSCHGHLDAHGGARRDVRLCVTCHTDQTTDAESGNRLVFNELIHKIHRGRDLPSVARGPVGAIYEISGFQDVWSVYAEHTADGVKGVRFPRNLGACSTCHAGAPGEERAKAVSIAACTTCHDTTSFDAAPPAGMDRHSGGARTDADCASCHAPGASFDPAVAHLDEPGYAAAAGLTTGLQLTIDGLTGVKAGASPTLSFHATDSKGPVDIGELRGLSASLSGPQGAPPTFSLPGIDLSGATALGGGAYSLELAATIPAMPAGGAVLLGLQGKRDVDYVRRGAARVFQDFSPNPVIAVAADGTDAVATVAGTVDQARCESCHGTVRAHDGAASSVTYCSTCHVAGATDAANRPAGDPASIDMRAMVHAIHRGTERESPYVVYGPDGAHAYGDVRFPGELDRCDRCHTDLTKLRPGAAACTACHDGQDAADHARLETTSSGREGCDTCHAPGRELGLDKVHAPLP